MAGCGKPIQPRELKLLGSRRQDSLALVTIIPGLGDSLILPCRLLMRRMCRVEEQDNGRRLCVDDVKVATNQ